MKQEKVPALIDNRARFALEKGLISAKPHGHGDVHTLLYQYGLPQKWVAEGRKWVFFFQDTNALAFMVLPSLLGVSARNRFEMNFLTFMRFPREAVGGIMKLTRGEENMTINVEYNQIEALLKSSGWHAEGDASNGTLGLGTPDLAQYSPFPGNSNTLVFSLPEYLQTLERTGGAMPEFVNPKYADATKTVFKSATRLECMMQDYPKLLSSGARIGFTQYDRWVCFSAVKNNLADAAVKSKQGLPPQCAGTGEAEYYSTTCRLLQLLGVEVGPDSDTKSFAGITYNFYPKVIVKPSFACTLYEMRERIRGHWRIAPQACLVLAGRSTQFTDLVVEGVLRCGDSAPHYVPVEPSDPEYLQIRGFKLHN
jgi:UDP-sugar pyrophosphorylase